ncbi:putative phosphatase YwpJ [Phycisphaerae bacterium RAS1]|nr:putative phosphatase YwpJ [Phycisphaerae bacterium RAS1]
MDEFSGHQPLRQAAVARGTAARRYDLAAIDLDGTLLDSTHCVPRRNRQALHRAHERGMKIVLCTGRSFPETLPIIESLGLELDCTVTAFGAIVSDVASRRTLHREPFEPALALELTAWYASHGYVVQWLLDREQAGFDAYCFDGPRRHAAVDRWLERTECVVRSAAAPPDAGPSPVRISIIDDGLSLTEMTSKLEGRFGARVAHNLLRAPSYDLCVIETFAPQVNKWRGIEFLCRRWNIDPARTVAIGDDVNDVQMIRAAGLGAAMSNGHAAAHAAAQRILPRHDECGVAVLLEELLDA